MLFRSTLSFHGDTADFIENMFRNRGVPMNASNREQAVLPDNCLLIRNTLGTASGMWFERDGRSLILRRGLPSEKLRRPPDKNVRTFREENGRVAGIICKKISEEISARSPLSLFIPIPCQSPRPQRCGSKSPRSKHPQIKVGHIAHDMLRGKNRYIF